MTSKVVPLDSVKHCDLRVKVDRSYSHIAQQNMVPLMAFEFLPASTNFPIVFVKQSETGKFKSVALMGLENGENVVFSDGKVKTNYVPVNIKRYPFSAGAASADEASMMLCIDENSQLLNNSEGFAIFDEGGQPSAETTEVTQLLTDILARDVASDVFVDFLVEHNLIEPAELTLSLGEEGKRKINGIYKISEEALNELDDDVVLQLYHHKYLPAIYAHLASLGQFNRLLQLKANFTPS
jgi:hypothetical protein